MAGVVSSWGPSLQEVEVRVPGQSHDDAAPVEAADNQLIPEACQHTVWMPALSLMPVTP